MKNVIKRISAIAMAFTLLGAGTTIAKNTVKSDYTLTASAAYCPNHNGTTTSWGEWELEWQDRTYVPASGLYYPSTAHLIKYEYYNCAVCGRRLGKTGYCQRKTVSAFNYLIGNY
ncbi:hypothetical protein [Ruminococcus flavefaciens]|uniref:hypothetical protein n=1 Tax=Ruminococcus flavefaciens TaxID=1265 RepID=UPI00037B625E|nr:hypothetical protein [Ruminococcus flavefaciens]